LSFDGVFIRKRQRKDTENERKRQGTFKENKRKMKGKDKEMIRTRQREDKENIRENAGTRSEGGGRQESGRSAGVRLTSGRSGERCGAPWEARVRRGARKHWIFSNKFVPRGHEVWARRPMRTRPSKKNGFCLFFFLILPSFPRGALPYPRVV